MNWIDAIVIIAIVGVALLGWRLGLVKAVLMAIGVYVGVTLGGALSGLVSQWLTGSIESKSIVDAVAYAIVGFAIFLVVQVLGAIITKTIKMVMLGPVNTLGGLAVGALAGFIIGGMFIAFLARLAFIVPEQPLEKINVVDTRERLENALVGGNMPGVYIDVKNKLPGHAFGMIPDDFNKALDALDRAREAKVEG